ncbi:MAG TPA: PD-(D/E)XK nuclease family protein [Longimicrobiales bacterium]
MATEKGLRGTVPDRPISEAEARERFPRLRQSLLATFDDCELSALFSLRYENGWSTHPQARGTIFHRVAAECLRQMKINDSEQIPVGAALEILEDKIRQRDVPPEDRVRVPLRELRQLEKDVRIFAANNTFSVRNILHMERRLETTLTYNIPETGERIERVLSGQLDLLIARPPDEAVVVDWKTGWTLPPKRDEDAEEPGISYHGYFQQQAYAILVMDNFPAVNAVTLREFYVRRTKARPARLTRAELPKVKHRMALLMEAFDMAVASGNPKNLRLETLEEHGHWKPSPGHHCGYCTASARCPLDDLYKGSASNEEEASRLAATRQVAMSVAKMAKKRLDPWVEERGPVEVAYSKGRRVYGPRTLSTGGVRIEEYTPHGTDRPSTKEVVPQNLASAMKASVEDARRERDEAKARRRAA